MELPPPSIDPTSRFRLLGREFYFLFPREIETEKVGIRSVAAEGVLGAERVQACGGDMRLKPGIPRQIMSIDFGLGVLLAIHFNRDKFLCAFF